MEIKNVNTVYFSATYTTQKIVRNIAEKFTGRRAEFDITQQAFEQDVVFGSDDLLIVGMPVYAGRLPAQVLPSLRRFKGDSTPAIIVCVYGNRDYDDALLELKETVEANGFKVISAGAFIAQHSIFPQVGAGRPDDNDMRAIEEFADKSRAIIHSIDDISIVSEPRIKGRHPYRGADKVPLVPSGDKKCNECKTCVKLCPSQAISEKNPRKTKSENCIACGRCIVVCPQGARRFTGLLHAFAKKKFIAAHSERKEPESIFVITSNCG